MYKLIFTDVDGTLIDNENRISERTRNAFIACQEKGIKVVIATGRPDFMVFDHLRTLKLNKYGGAISNFNGTKVTLCDTGEIISENTIDIDTTREFLKFMEEYHFSISIMKDEYIYSTVDRQNELKMFFSERPAYEKILNNENKELFVFPKIKYHIKDTLSDKIDFEPYSIQFGGETDELLKVFPEIHKKFSDRIHLTFTSDNSVEAMPIGVTKGTSMKKLADHYGIKLSEIVAFGDSQNDFEMIRDAGMGVAMGNGQAVVKEVADYITLKNVEDGVAVFLEENVLNK
ncbi:Cof-type HAD-IIB family hydrolase [Helcococcus kunzii]|uniref:Cof-type HAD-IIB family hydrolase n=1 Tax=Helcococcus kunzii TaxID=40091 RepID=UPI0038B18E4A